KKIKANPKAKKEIAKIQIKKANIAKPKAEKPLKKSIEPKNENVAASVKKKVVPKKVKPIGTAVFRGKKEIYDFQVFPLDEKFEQMKAVYIISKRKTDRKKRAHHKLVYI